MESLGVMYRDSMQDKALSSRLPIVSYKPNAVISQAIFRIAEKIMQSETTAFDADSAGYSFDLAAEEASDDFTSKLSIVEDLVGGGALSVAELAEIIKQQQYDINVLKKENILLKSKIVKAAALGFKV